MKSLKRKLYGWIERRFLDGCSNFNSLATRQLCRSKHLARTTTDGATTRYLAKNGKTLLTIPDVGETVRLHHRIALAAGGVVENINQKTIPQENIELFLKIPNLLQANLLGIDAIFTEGIEVSWCDQQVIFLEINSRPYLKMHEYPRYGAKDDLHSSLKKLATLAIDDKDIF